MTAGVQGMGSEYFRPLCGSRDYAEFRSGASPSVRNRDNFTEETKNKRGKRVAWHCARPGCVAPTVSATADGKGVITLGRAAHITAAALGGLRYDVRLSQAERRSGDNGIWLCGECANLIDADDAPFTEHTIREWKRNAQKRAWAELVLSHTQSGHGSPFGAEEITDALSLAVDAVRASGSQAAPRRRCFGGPHRTFSSRARQTMIAAAISTARHQGTKYGTSVVGARVL